MSENMLLNCTDKSSPTQFCKPPTRLNRSDIPCATHPNLSNRRRRTTLP